MVTWRSSAFNCSSNEEEKGGIKVDDDEAQNEEV